MVYKALENPPIMPHPPHTEKRFDIFTYKKLPTIKVLIQQTNKAIISRFYSASKFWLPSFTNFVFLLRYL